MYVELNKILFLYIIQVDKYPPRDINEEPKQFNNRDRIDTQKEILTKNLIKLIIKIEQIPKERY